MRPDRIIVGEVRGAEALDMLQAMNTGHEGSLSTVHANSPRDALSRLETMVLMAGYELPLRAIRQHVSSALDLIVQLDRLDDGTRRIAEIAEVQRMEGEMITLQKLFEFKVDRIDADRKIVGELEPTGLRPASSASSSGTGSSSRSTSSAAPHARGGSRGRGGSRDAAASGGARRALARRSRRRSPDPGRRARRSRSRR